MLPLYYHTGGIPAGGGNDMAICYSCSNTRLGNSGGDTLGEAMGATLRVVEMGHATGAAAMMDAIIQQAGSKSICSSCMSDLRTLRRELDRFL